MKKITLTLILLTSFLITIFSQNTTTYLEEVYVHTDKSIYSPGDDLWFKAYILDDELHTPSNLSKILYVTIIDSKNNNVISEKFPIQSGATNGNLQLSDTLKKGKYQIIAFTENMQGLSPAFWFNSKILIDPSPIDLWKIDYYPDLTELSNNRIKGEIVCKSTAQFPISDARITIDLLSEDKKLHTESLKTDSLGKAYLNWDIPEKNNVKEIVININATYLNKSKELKINIPTGSKGIHLTFFPESGYLVQGLKNQVAFKATDNFGSDIKISGQLINQNDSVLENINTFHQGMGIFSFTPEKGQKYYVKLNYPEFIDSLFVLPEVSESGYVLSFKQVEKNVMTLSVNMTGDLKGKKVKLSVSNGLQYENLFETNLKNEKQFSFITTALPVGIASLTLFSEDVPVAERLIFINKYKKLNLTIETEKEIYDPREKVELLIKTTDFEGNPAPANLSLSVAEKNTMDETNPDITSFLLLKSKLAGVRGDISFYLQENNKADSALNLLLMTHGWRKIEKIEEYTGIIKNTENIPGIRGTVYTKKNKPAKNAQVQILDTKTWQIVSTETNQDGKFFIPLDDYLLIAGSESLSISAAIPNKTKDLIISIDPDVDNTVLSKFKLGENILLAYNLPQNMKVNKKDPTLEYTNFDETTEFIEEVAITEKKYDPAYQEARKSPYNVYKKDAEELQTNSMTWTPESPVGLTGSGIQDHSILELVRPVAPSFEIINGQIVFRGRNSIVRSNVTGALFVVNGVPMGNNITNMNWINPQSVKEVKVITSPGAALRYGSSSKGLIEITYLEGNEIALKPINIVKDENISVIKGYKINKEFYSPDYSGIINDEEKTFDSRSTLYWNPNIIIDSSGTYTISFYNGDKRTFFRCNVQGIGTELLGNTKKDLRVN